MRENSLNCVCCSELWETDTIIRTISVICSLVVRRLQLLWATVTAVDERNQDAVMLFSSFIQKWTEAIHSSE